MFKYFISEWIISFPSGVIFILLGFFGCRDTWKNADRKDIGGTIYPFWDGMEAGIGFLLLGLVIVIVKIVYLFIYLIFMKRRISSILEHIFFYVLFCVVFGCTNEHSEHILNKKKVRVSQSIKNEEKELRGRVIKNSNDINLLGVWKIDSMRGSNKTQIIYIKTRQGYIFKSNGIVSLYEKMDDRLREIPQGDFTFEKNSLVIGKNESYMNGKIQKWEINNLSKNNIIMKGDFVLTPKFGSPILFLSKTYKDSI
jgi:hypothetical protein